MFYQQPSNDSFRAEQGCWLLSGVEKLPQDEALLYPTLKGQNQNPWKKQFVPIKIPTLRPSLATGAPAKIRGLLGTLLGAQVMENGLQFLPSALEREELKRERMQAKASRTVRGRECLSQGRRLLIYFAQQNAG